MKNMTYILTHQNYNYQLVLNPSVLQSLSIGTNHRHAKQADNQLD
jgi:hypothetical protein